MPDPERQWRTLGGDDRALDRIEAPRLLELLCDLSPDISRALWDFLRMTNPGWEAAALRPGTEEVDERAQVTLDTLLARLSALYGSFDVPLGRLFIGAFLRGGFLGELVLDERGRSTVDFATPDPAIVRFEAATDPVRGSVQRPFQWVNGQRRYLDVPTVRYVPVDPFPGSPYGRSMASPALSTALFTLGLLHDLRRVVAQQGYPRLDLEMGLDDLLKIMPRDVQADPEKVGTWLDAVQRQVEETYRALQPDDAFVHNSAVKVNRPVGAIDSSSLGAIDGLIRFLERYSVRALKTMPLLMAVSEGTSEANANRQWEVYAAGIKALQHRCENLLEYLLTLALQAEGRQATVRFRFAELRAAELLRDAQVDALQIDNALKRYWAGWINQDEAARLGAGVDAADQPEPRATPSGYTVGTGATGLTVGETASADPGANRARRPVVTTRAVETFVPAGAADPFDPLPDTVTISAADINAAMDLWDTLMPEYAGLLDAAVAVKGDV